MICSISFSEPLTISPYHQKLWQRLLHSDNNQIPNLYSNSKSLSEIDDEKFFITADGQNEPDKEFIENQNRVNEPDYRCKFPARYIFFKYLLPNNKKVVDYEISEDEFKDCKELYQWINDLDPSSLSLIFPSAYINNPASAFGHTFLRINERSNNPLLGYGVSYGAETGDDGGLLFGFKGLTGLYRGFYTFSPYYKHLDLYSNLESRDIIEYKLSFSKEETFFLSLHLWELQNINTDYYFFDENCSYHILSLINILRPESDLINNFFFRTFPAETIRLVYDEGLIEEAKLRPSLTKKVLAWENTQPEISDKVKEIIERESDSSSDQETLSKLHSVSNVSFLTGFIDYVTYLKISNKIDSKKADKINFDSLKLLNKGNQELNSNIANNISKSSYYGVQNLNNRLGINYNFRVSNNKADNNLELSFRPAYQDLLDISAEGSDLNTLTFMTPHLFIGEDIKLDKFTLLNIKSYSKRSELIKPISWELLLENSRDISANFTRSNEASLGAGYTNQISDHNFIVNMFGLQNRFNDDILYNYLLTAYYRFLVVHEINDNFRVNLENQLEKSIVNEDKIFSTSSLSFSYNLNRNEKNEQNIFNSMKYNSNGELEFKIGILLYY